MHNDARENLNLIKTKCSFETYVIYVSNINTLAKCPISSIFIDDISVYWNDNVIMP